MALRSIWKGAITFGLVHIPVALYPATQDTGIDFDWIDKRSHDPVGYKRINKRTGREIDSEQIVRGVKQEAGEYVILSDDEIKAAYPARTQTIAIERFVQAPQIAFPYLEKPYVLGPEGRGGEHVYALLREAMAGLGVIGIARVVMHLKEHLCALVASGPALMLNTLRWPAELRSLEGIDFPAEGKSGAKLKEAELKMARELIGNMTGPWETDDFREHFGDAINKLVKQRAAAGKTSKVEALEEAPPDGASNVVDLTELLRRSLEQPRAGAAKAQAAKPARARKRTAGRAKSQSRGAA